MFTFGAGVIVIVVSPWSLTHVEVQVSASHLTVQFSERAIAADEKTASAIGTSNKYFMVSPLAGAPPDQSVAVKEATIKFRIDEPY